MIRGDTDWITACAQPHHHQGKTNTERTHGRNPLPRSTPFRYTYDEAPIIEARREFTFPDLPSRGVFIFLFVGANRICRAVVRKGNLSYVQRMSVAGHILRVIDDTNAPVDDAAVVCNGTVYNADDRGEVCVPFTSGTSHVTANLTLRSGNFHVTSNLRIAPEDYALDAAIYVDREQLITGHRATVALRAALYLASAGNIRVPVSMVENVEMVVKVRNACCGKNGKLGCGAVVAFPTYSTIPKKTNPIEKIETTDLNPPSPMQPLPPTPRADDRHRGDRRLDLDQAL